MLKNFVSGLLSPLTNFKNECCCLGDSRTFLPFPYPLKWHFTLRSKPIHFSLTVVNIVVTSVVSWVVVLVVAVVVLLAVSVLVGTEVVDVIAEVKDVLVED